MPQNQGVMAYLSAGNEKRRLILPGGAGLSGWRRVLLGIIFALQMLPAQDKKPLDHDAYEIWNHIYEQQISPNGKWVMYSLGPEDGDPELRIHDVDGGAVYTIARADSAQFSFNSRFAIAMIRPPRDSVKAAKRAKTKKEDMPRDSLAIVDLLNGETTRIARVMSYQLPGENGQWLAYRLEKMPPADSAAADTTAEGIKDRPADLSDLPAAGPDPAARKNQKKERPVGTTLVLRHLEESREWQFEFATEYAFAKNGVSLAYTAASPDSSGDGIFAVLTTTAERIPVLRGPGDYKQLRFDESGEQLAFLSNRDDIAAKQPAFTLFHWSFEGSAPRALATAGTPGIPAGWWVSEHGDLHFSHNGQRLFFGTAPKPAPEPEQPTPEDEKVNVEIWHWKDPRLMPQQRKELEKEKKRTYLALADLKTRRVMQLADETVPEVTVGSTGNADVAVGISNRPYQQLISWDYPAYYDIYLLHLKTGHRRLVKPKIQWEAQLSPQSKYLTWWDRTDSTWYALDIKNNREVPLTAALPYPVFNEQHDWPYLPDPYGSAGWTAGDGLFLVYDRHDLWGIDPTGTLPPRCITEEAGRRDNLRFRYVSLDPEEKFIAPEAPLLLSAFHLEDKTAGFYRDQVSSLTPPERLIWMPRQFSNPQKARQANRLLFTRQNFLEFPDLWIAAPDFAETRQISHANPQQSEYQWGSVEMVTWTSLDGLPLQGLLYKPENFDLAKKYPMIVYFYEKYSDQLHRHYAPAPHRSIINFTFYASRGYLVFVPDIHYKIGFPGESALHSVLPGVTHLIRLGFVDAANIGVQGHSWGGYQIAYLVTRTNIFKAAAAGAPVSNMSSAYGGIRWRSGLSRMFQYERTQSRIGGSIWKYPLRYLENSPIFWADRIQTPLLIMHNDHDGAVPWYQGIELFVALRRLGKPVWLINYVEEPHWPLKYHKRRDWQIRLQQYFDHFLKGAPAPEWLEKGIPALKREQTLGLEPATTETE